jgi:hypothetical protein
MKQLLIEMTQIDVENNKIGPWEYLKKLKEYNSKSDSELKVIVESQLLDWVVNEDITLEDYEAIMNELDAVEECDEDPNEIKTGETPPDVKAGAKDGEEEEVNEDFNLDEILDSLDEEDELNEYMKISPKVAHKIKSKLNISTKDIHGVMKDTIGKVRQSLPQAGRGIGHPPKSTLIK